MVKNKEKDAFEFLLQYYMKHENKLSFLIDNPLPEKFGKGKESYGPGHIVGIDKKFIYFDLIHNTRLASIVIKKSMILSMWVYRR